jgi:hypothetical protein
MDKNPLSRVIVIHPPSPAAVAKAVAQTAFIFSEIIQQENTPKLYFFNDNIVNEPGHDIIAIENNDFISLQFLANSNYTWNRDACLTVCRAGIPIERKKKMLTLLLKGEVIISEQVIQHMIENENAVLLECVLKYVDRQVVLFGIIKAGKFNLFKQIAKKHSDRNVLEYAIKLNKREFVIYITGELRIRYNSVRTSEFIVQFTQNTAILDYFNQTQSEIFRIDDFWNEAIMHENIDLLEWGYINFGLDLDVLLKVACEKDKFKSVAWICSHTKNIQREKRKGDDLFSETFKKARIETEGILEEEKKEKQTRKILCDVCQGSYSMSNKSTHYKTKKHRDALASKEDGREIEEPVDM